MAKEKVESFLIAGGESEDFRQKYDKIKTKEEFVKKAQDEGFDFTIDEFNQVLQESGDSFDLIGNPGKRQIWWF